MTKSSAPTNRKDVFLAGGPFWIRDHAAQSVQPPPHRHDYFQVHLNLAGTTQHALGAAVLPVVPGTVSFVLPLRVHHLQHVRNARFFVINYALDFLRPELAVGALELEDVPLERMPELAPFLVQEHADFVLAGADLADAQNLCARMQQEQVRGGFYATELIRADLFRLIGLVCRRHESQLQSLLQRDLLRGSRRASMARVSRYIREHLHEPITLADAAAAAFLSPSYLAHLLKRESGRSFGELLAEQRVDLACRLLAGTQRTITDIAASVGFQDEAYFSRRFRQLRGESPSQWRQSHRSPARPR
jgi:AraC-like DNA-binding protein